MKKTYCDACEKEVKHNYPFTCLVHILDDGKYSGGGYVTTDEVNGKWLSVSGKEESKDLCLECYNRIYSSAWEEFIKIKEENKLL